MGQSCSWYFFEESSGNAIEIAMGPDDPMTKKIIPTARTYHIRDDKNPR